VHRRQAIDGLEFDHDAVVDEQIDAKGIGKVQPVEVERYGLLAFDEEAASRSRCLARIDS
jgi:hypothetical protein